MREVCLNYDKVQLYVTNYQSWGKEKERQYMDRHKERNTDKTDRTDM